MGKKPRGNKRGTNATAVNLTVAFKTRYVGGGLFMYVRPENRGKGMIIGGKEMRPTVERQPLGERGGAYGVKVCAAWLTIGIFIGWRDRTAEGEN